MPKEPRLPINLIEIVLSGQNFYAKDLIRCTWSASGKRLSVQSKFGGFQRVVMESTKESVTKAFKQIVDAVNNAEE